MEDNRPDPVSSVNQPRILQEKPELFAVHCHRIVHLQQDGEITKLILVLRHYKYRQEIPFAFQHLCPG